MIQFLIACLRIYTFVLIARIVFSWLPPRHMSTDLYRFLHKITEPVLKPFRRIIPPMGGIDFSPIAAFIVLELAIRLLRGL